MIAFPMMEYTTSSPLMVTISSLTCSAHEIESSYIEIVAHAHAVSSALLGSESFPAKVSLYA